MLAMAERFRGFLPVVVDLETGGFHAATDALLQIGAVLLECDPEGRLVPGQTLSLEVTPFEGAHIDPEALAVNGIDPTHPLRPALPEEEALIRLFRLVRRALTAHSCSRAILTGHNAFFDLGFLNAAATRSAVKRNPFHPFSTFDTVTLAGVLLGQTVLAKAVAEIGIPVDSGQTHQALYDAELTAQLFCRLVNRCEEWTRAGRADQACERPSAP
ncbi:ribonuclease T [mine drainage metagenome]|uniref:Ribonuclease T n=2 Tax=mine drainage metagenome TaxID=410659 RepID=T1CT99_9ZZZZ